MDVELMAHYTEIADEVTAFAAQLRSYRQGARESSNAISFWIAYVRISKARLPGKNRRERSTTVGREQ
jgi:hypothetical protein